MIKKISLLLILIFSISCITGQKKEVKKIKQKNKSEINIFKQKVGQNTVKEAVKRAKKYADNLNFDLDYIRNKGLPDKKYLAEYLGLYLKLKKFYNNKDINQQIQEKLKPFYNKINQQEFHNMAVINDKLFKKNSMSYMRIMWLLDQLGYNITDYKKQFFKIKKRMDNHMKLRGEWQRAVFDKYYDYFKFQKPIELQYAKKLKGPIDYQKPIDFYNKTNAYILTHFVFTAYDYGNSLTQNRFDKDDLEYLKTILPQIISKFESINNDDLVGELLTCQVLLRQNNTSQFNNSFNRLLYRQNNDGSFGSYERYRKKVGNDVEFRSYLHTTLVDVEMFIEDAFRKNKSIKK
jgi:hypothetical protein